eukprot:15471662-Alexandrium_andersonii.AAC.1
MNSGFAWPRAGPAGSTTPKAAKAKGQSGPGPKQDQSTQTPGRAHDLPCATAACAACAACALSLRM